MVTISGAYEFVPAETVPPTAPQNLDTSNVAYTGFTLSWDTSTDNDTVVGYYVYKDYELYTYTDTTEVDVVDLSQGTSYAMTVKAKDRNGNISESSDTLFVKTHVADDSEPQLLQQG